MNKWKKRILIIFIAVILNVAGRYTAYKLEWPMYMNLCGTILASYLLGPAAGTISAVISCAFSLIFCSTDWHYIIADIAVAIASGLIARKNKYFERYFLIFSSTAFFTLVKAPILLIINLSTNGGKSGLNFADAVIDFLESLSAPMWLRYTLSSIYISFADVLAAMILIYFGMKIYKSFGRRRKADRLKRELMKKVTLGLVLSVAFTSFTGYSDSYADNSISFVEKLYNSDNGLVGGCLNDIAMTKDGSMWIGTYGGLFRFNGSKFILIDNVKSVRSIQTLFVDGDDRLWVGTQDAGATIMNIDMSWRTLDMSKGLPSNSVKCISQDSNGLYYFGTTSGVVVAQYQNGEVNILKTDTKVGNVRDMSPDKNGHMIVMTNIGAISCYESGESVCQLDLGKFTAKGIKHDENDNIYIGTDSEEILIYEYTDEGFKEKRKIPAEGMKSIKDFCFGDNDITYIAADNGIGYLDSSEHLVMIESGEFNNSIDHIFKDYQGNIWFTSSRCGLLCLGRSSFIDVFKLCNEKNIVCNAVREFAGYLYVGSNDGLKILDVKAGKSIKNEITDVFEGLRIRSMLISRTGNLLVASYDKGIMEITPQGEIAEYISPEESERVIRVIYETSDGTVIASSDAGMVFMKDHKVTGKLRLGEELLGGAILNMLETDDHTLICGTDGDGIVVIKDGKCERYINHEQGLPSGVVLRVVDDKRSGGYFILTGSGLCYMDKDYNIREIGMPYYNNFDIAINDNDEMFILGGAGIYICDYDFLMSEGRMENYTLLDTKAGLPGSITSNAWHYVNSDEIIYICGTSGIYQLDLNNYEMKVEEFKTKITAVRRDGVFEDITQVGTIVIPKDTDRIELDLEINNYTTADPTVSFYLSGVDTEKTTVPASKLGGVTYYDIPSGNHEFVISVLDEKGKELSKQTYVFSKERELYETVGFMLYFYLMLFTFIIFLVVSIVQGALWSQRKKESGRHEQVVTQLEREKAEALERALHMEENANRTKSEFLANMSHEIRTPINAIIGMDTMIMRESGEANIRNYARDIDVAGKTLLSLINDILDFSKIESGRLELIMGEYDLSTLINGVINMVKPNADSKKLGFEVNVNPEIPDRLYGDEVRLEQIIINILNNAVKYTEKGKVSFSVDYEEAESGSILLKVSVKDTGIGIKPEDIEKLFSPYERIEEHRNRKIEGTGLGLSITKNLLEKMGSRLEVSSVYGQGSEFRFVINQTVRNGEKIGNYRDRAGKKEAVVSEIERYHAPEARVLVVDDVEMNLIVTRNLLKRIEVKVDTVLSGEEALRLTAENQYDIILLDSMMPGMSGEDTLQNIKKQCPLNAETPVIVLTAHAVDGAREEFLRLGYTNYLAKPIDGIKLESMIQCYLPDEKIIYNDEDKADKNEEAVVETELSLISKIEGVDVEKGIETSGGEDAYIVICRNFYDTAKMRIGLIEDAFNKEDIENYTIQLHALKSSARLIGALEFSKQALELETAGREGDWERIKKDTGGILDRYRWFYDRLDGIFGKKD